MRNKLDFGMLKPSRTLPRLRDAMIGGWYFPGDELSRDRMSLINFAFVNNVIANLVGGNYLTGLLLLMNADDGFIGLTGMIPFAANIVQLIAPIIMERFTKRKTCLLYTSGRSLAEALRPRCQRSGHRARAGRPPHPPAAGPRPA